MCIMRMDDALNIWDGGDGLRLEILKMQPIGVCVCTSMNHVYGKKFTGVRNGIMLTVFLLHFFLRQHDIRCLLLVMTDIDVF